MKTSLAVLADFANVTREGKLNILGVFHRVYIRSLPAVHPQMHLVLELEAEYVERDREQDVEIRVEGPDGEQLIALAAKVALSGGEPGRKLASGQILTIGNLFFRRDGVHTFNIFINGHLDKWLELEVVRRHEEDPEQIKLLGT